MLSVYSFNQPLWRYGRRGLGGGGTVGEDRRCLIQSFIGLSLYDFLCVFIPLTPCLDLGMRMGVEISHGDAET